MKRPNGSCFLLDSYSSRVAIDSAFRISTLAPAIAALVYPTGVVGKCSSVAYLCSLRSSFQYANFWSSALWITGLEFYGDYILSSVFQLLNPRNSFQCLIESGHRLCNLKSRTANQKKKNFIYLLINIYLHISRKKELICIDIITS